MNHSEKRILICGILEDVPNYIKAIQNIGFTPVVATTLPTSEGFALSDFDGLLLPGGSDIDPILFGQENHGSRTIDRDLDDKQLAMTELFVRAKKPILGICKGCQVINVYFGGTLIQDLTTNERHQWDGDDRHHLATAVSGTYMEKLYGSAPVTINSAHHQGLDRIGEDLVVCQRSEDGVVEAVCHKSLPILATQWHPERMTDAWKQANPDRRTARHESVDGGLVFDAFARLVRAAAIDEDPEHILDRIKCFALDMDGTIYLGDRWIDGAREFLARVEEKGRRFVFLTNNSSKNPQVYVEKLRRMGLAVTEDRIVTSGQATCYYLKKHFPGKRVFLLGNELLREEFVNDGILLDDENPEVVVVGFDTTLNYEKLCKVCDFVRAGLPYLSTHPDFNCPTETGFIPDAGAIHAFIHASAFRYPDRIIGKPNGDIMDYLMDRVGLSRDEVIMIGDRLYTDVAAGKNNGLYSMLVLSGEANMAEAATSEVEPHLIFSSVKQIIPYISPL